MEQNFSKIIKTIILFGLLSCLLGVLKNYIILDIFDGDVKNIAGLSSYTSLFVSIIISCIVLALVGFICFMVIDLFELQINTVEFSSSFINFIYILFLAEILKGGLVVFVLNDELNDLIVDETFEEQLKNTSWFFFNNIAENISIMIGILTFIMSFKKLTKATKLLEVILLSITIGIGLFISNMDWT
jgi:hypothetical protein